MNEEMSIKEIGRQYSGEWVALEVIEWSYGWEGARQTIPVRARVVGHHLDSSVLTNEVSKLGNNINIFYANRLLQMA